MQELGREPLPEEIAAEMGVNVSKIHHIKKISQAIVSLETPVGDDEEDSVLLEFIKDEKTWQPDTQTCQKVIARALKNGVILAGAGLNRNVIRLLIPLVITDEQLNEGLDVVEEAVKFVSNRK